jgi:acetyl-CoA synthetase
LSFYFCEVSHAERGGTGVFSCGGKAIILKRRKEVTKETKTASILDEGPLEEPPEGLKTKAHIETIEEYRALYERSIKDPERFWSELADHLDWYKKWDEVLEYDFKKPEINWFKGGKLNASYNCLDRHLNSRRRNKVALIWQGELPEETRSFTYQQLHDHVCKFANVLKKFGVRKGDRVSLYLPMVPELPIVMLACARMGAIHSVVFAGLGYKALRDRINDSGSKVLITADGCYRGGRVVQNKANADEALKGCPGVEKVIVVKRLGIDAPFVKERDLWWHEEMAKEDIKLDSEPAIMDAEDSLFILYTSGSTDKPRGVIHTTGGYLLFVYQTLKWVFDVKDEDVFFCTADIGGATGHSYGIYGPLALGATTLIFEGIPTYPNPDRFWEIVERYKVSILYTAPAAIRALMQEGEGWVEKRGISSLRILGSVGEPIHPEAWKWYHVHVGQEKCPIIDTWSQTETGGFLISPLPITPLKPGSATLPFPGVVPKILREDGTECDVDEVGFLVIANPWPGMLRGLWNDSDRGRFKETYFKLFPGYYFTGDAAKMDADGYCWLMGRTDDVINVSGHRIGAAEIEGALASHPSVAETAVIGIPHHVKGQGIYALVTLKIGIKNSEDLREELLAHARKVIGPIATPDKLQFAEVLPKIRSGKTMRRILRKIAEERIEELGGISIDSRAYEKEKNISSEEADPTPPRETERPGEKFLGEDRSPLDINRSLFYHPGHTWVKVEKADEVRVGLDCFLRSIVGKVKVVVLPLSGRRCLQGESLCSIIQEEGILHIVFPVSGSILSVNQKLKDQPELITKDPLGEGFLVTLKPKNLQRDQKHLFFGEAALFWYQKELERFKATVVSKLCEEERVGMTMQDGGIRLRDIKTLVDPERYIQLVSTFLRNGEKDFPRSKCERGDNSKFQLG